MTDTLVQACQHALRHNLQIKPDESVLIVTDEAKREIGLAFKNAAFHFSHHVELIEISVQEFNGQEPPDFAAQKMQNAGVILMPPNPYRGRKPE